MSEKWLKINISREIIATVFIIFLAIVFIAANLLQGFSLFLFALIAIGGFLISLFFPFSGLLASTFLTITFERFFTLQSFWIDKTEYKLYPLDFVILGTILGMVFHFLKRGWPKFEFKRIDWFVLGFIFLNILYFFFALINQSQDNSLAFSTLKNYAFYPILFFLTSLLVISKEKLIRLAKFFLAGCLAIIVFIFLGIIRGEGFWTEFTPLSTFGKRTLAFTHGFYLSLSFLGMLVFLVISHKKKDLAFWQWIIPVWALGVLGTLMRHLWIGIILVLFSFFTLFFSKKEKGRFAKIISKYVLVFSILLILAFFFSCLFPQSDFSQKANRIFKVIEVRSQSINVSEKDESFSWRELVWKSAFEEYKKHPLEGLGLGKKIYVEKDDYKDFIEIRNVHNSYLSIFFQLGILGIVIFLAIIWQAVKMTLTGIKGKSRDTYLILGSVLAFFLFVTLFQPYLETNLLSIFFWINLGVIRSLEKYKK